ncbi:MAG: hypothetical protein RSC24_06425 [Clostridium sp.]
MAKTTRKCCMCGSVFDIFKNNYIKTNSGRYSEVKCYKEKQKRKGFSDETIDLEVSEILKVQLSEKQRLEAEYLKDSKKKLVAKNNELNRKENLDMLINYLSEEYEVSVFSNHFFIKLAQINNGTLRGLRVGIPYTDILEMFKLQQRYLNNTYERNLRYGKNMVGIQRVNYDLAIITNKYDSYVKWKEKQSILEDITTIANETSSDLNINYSIISKAGKSSESDGIDINELLDDIY